MEATPQRPFLPGSEPVAHHFRPDSPRRTQFGDLFEEVIVNIEEEAQARSEAVNVKPSVDGGPNIRDAVSEGKRQLLERGRARLADVVAADRDRVPTRDVPGTELERVDDQFSTRSRREDV